MHIGVIGAGVVGLTTADALHQRGLQVTVVEAQEQPGTQASFANGAQLSYSYTDPLASPQLIRSLPAILLGRSKGIQIRHRADVRYLRWAASFLWNCLPHRTRQNARALSRLAARSAELMTRYHADADLSYYRATAGKLVLLEGAPDAAARARLASKQADGIAVELVSRADAIAIEPVLDDWVDDFRYALHAPDDGVADTGEFVCALARRLCGHGVSVQLGRRVLGVQRDGTSFHVRTEDGEEQKFDAVVVCAGNEAMSLLSQARERQELLPITGYSVSLPVAEKCPKVSITALAHRLVVARLANRVRIAGFADINPQPDQHSQRIDTLLATAARLAPGAADYSVPNPSGWVGQRPSTPGGPPLVGQTSVPGLYQNIGHGSLGWTLAAVTAEIVADAVERDGSGH